MKLVHINVFIIFACIALSCRPLISLHDPSAYKNDIDLKVDFQFLIDQSKEQYDKHEADRTEFLKRLYKAYEYEKGRDNNMLTVKQYEIITKQGGVILGFFDIWKTDGSLDEDFRNDTRKQSDALFDEVIRLEGLKRKEGFKLNLSQTDN